MGLYHIAKAVSFINSDCKLVRMLLYIFSACMCYGWGGM